MVALIRPRIGDFIKSAMWYNADLPKDKEIAEDKITDVILEMAWDNKVRTKPIEWEHVTPMSPQVPQPPDHMKGNVMCAIGAAEVIGMIQLGPDLTDELEPHELELLRRATRREYHKAGGLQISSSELDEIINMVGPETAGKEYLH